MIAAYLRVSSKSQTLDMQRAAILRAASTRGDEITSWYEEKLSGKTIARPELDRVRLDARGGKITRLYVFRLDRLARSGIRDTFEVVEDLRRCGVELVSISDGFALDGPAGEVVLAVMAWAAKMERLAINERIANARIRLESEGRAWGRPRRAFDVESARRMKAEGRSFRDIAVALKVPKTTVVRALRRA